jgi:hypothetical protein
MIHGQPPRRFIQQTKKIDTIAHKRKTQRHTCGVCPPQQTDSETRDDRIDSLDHKKKTRPKYRRQSTDPALKLPRLLQ